MTNRRMWTLVIVGLMLVGGLLSISRMTDNPASIPHSAAESPVTDGR